jgi:23S rRNA pseudouridine2605 synthase
MALNWRKQMRINKYLALCGCGSRRKCEQLVIDKRVSLNGKTIETLATQVDEHHDVVLLDKDRVKLPEDYVYYMLHKP